MKKSIFPYILLLLIALPLKAGAEPNVLKTLDEPKSVRLYEPLTLDLALPYIKDNPNDVNNVKVKAVIVAPSGKKMDAPLFCKENTPGSGSIWRLRFTPTETGRFQYYMIMETPNVRKETDSSQFIVLNSAKKGFLRGSPNNPYYLVFDSGEPYFGIGHNIAWVNNNSLKIFERYMDLLSKNGGNLSRVWVCSWSFPLEWEKLGEYNEDVCEKLDGLLKIAEEKGVYIIFTLDTYGSLMTEEGAWHEDDWDKNPYNKKNGGPCEEPEDFFRNKEAISHYKNKLRYILARWGYSPNILAIELWNEYNAPIRWVKDVTSYIGKNDCHKHFITTSHGYPWGKVFDEESIWNLKGISMITDHIYAVKDASGADSVLKQVTRNIACLFKKPFIISEYGIDASKSDKELDPAGIGTSLHNSIWLTALSKSFGTAMNWWWDSYIRPKDLYSHYRSLSLFLSDVDWNSDKIEYVDISPVHIAEEDKYKNEYRYVRILPDKKWGKAKTENIVISNEGEITGLCRPNKYLHGEQKEDMQTPHIFNVNYPVDGEFIIKVGKVSQGGHLYAYLDGKMVKARGFPCGKGEGPWKRSLYNKKYDIYQCIYNEDFKIKVPAGEHVVRLENKGIDWISIERITLTNYMPVDLANVRCFGLKVGEQMMLWIQNKDFNWENTSSGRGVNPVDNAYFFINDIDDGEYLIEWWDTFKGVIVSEKILSSSGGKLRVKIPSLFRDIACKVKKHKKY